MKNISFWKKSVYSALVFFGTLIMLSLIYAATTYYTDLPTVNSGSGLTATSWNNLVNYANKAVKQDTEVLTVTGGSVGIGTVSPAALLHINDTNGVIGLLKLSGKTSGSISHTIQNSSGIDNWQLNIGTDGYSIIDGTQSSYRMTIANSGNIGIGTSDPGIYKLYVNGNIKTAGSIFMGYERVSVDCNNVTSCTATCTAGKKILGGGCVRIAGGLNNLQDAQPNSDTVFTCSYGTAPTISRAYAICARIDN